MALCEIKTGQGSKVPKECSDWQGGKGKVGMCVEALARSPQFWSSYSGTFHIPPGSVAICHFMLRKICMLIIFVC